MEGLFCHIIKAYLVDIFPQIDVVVMSFHDLHKYIHCLKVCRNTRKWNNFGIEGLLNWATINFNVICVLVINKVGINLNDSDVVCMQWLWLFWENNLVIDFLVLWLPTSSTSLYTIRWREESFGRNKPHLGVPIRYWMIQRIPTNINDVKFA